LRLKIFRKFCRLDRTRIFFFAAGDERDGAPERGTGIGLEREMARRRGLVSGVGLGWTLVVSGVGLCWTLVPSIGFAASEEKDGAPKRGTGVGLEREEPA
jgi:hypothetical protein